jgi:hypothetical protein
MVIVVLARPQTDPRVALRGAGDEAAPPVRLLLHAVSKGPPPGPLRLVAELPGAGEARLSRRDYLQLGYAGLAGPGYLTVVAVGQDGQVHRYLPRGAGPAARVEPAAEARGLGPSVDLGQHRPGRLRVFAVLSPRPIDSARVEAAAAKAGVRAGALDLPGPEIRQVSGWLVLEP